MKPKDVLELTLFELEDLFEGFAEANEDNEDSKPLEGRDAVNALRDMGLI